jgi:sporulation protein YlmC with PRC-barrel domain
MKNLRFLLVSLSIPLLFSAMSVSAQDEMQSDQMFQSSQQMFGVERVSKLMGRTIMSREGEKLGTVKDLVIGEQGRVDYLILSYGDILGFGGRMVPIPVMLAQLPIQENDAVTLNISKQRLQDAPNFKEGNWPDFRGMQFEQQIQTYFGQDLPQQQPEQPSPFESQSPSQMPPDEDSWFGGPEEQQQQQQQY